MASKVKVTHPRYDEMLPVWNRCEDVYAGTEQVRRQGEKYLPKLAGESPEEYKARKDRTVLYNATKRTIMGYLGLLFRRAPQAVVPSKVKPMLGDITMSGSPLRIFAGELAEEVLKTGRVGIWVNHPPAAEGLTRADALLLHLRPSMRQYGAREIINWRSQWRENRWILTMVVLKEVAVEIDPDNEFKTIEVPQQRVLELLSDPISGALVYRVRIFQQDKDDKDILVGEYVPLRNGKPLDHIPFFFISPDDLDTDVDEPPFVDLVDVNISHYQTTADYENGCHWSGLPTPIITGYQPEEGEKIKVGTNEALVFPDPLAKANMLEVGTSGFSALEKNLDRKDKMMVILGARLLETQRPGVEAAETALIHRSGEQSILADISHTMSMGITAALREFVEWAGESADKVSCELDRKFFETAITADMINALVTAWQKGGISAQTRFEAFKRGELYPPDAQFEDEEALIKQGKSNLPAAKPPPEPPTPPSDPSAGNGDPPAPPPQK